MQKLGITRLIVNNPWRLTLTLDVSFTVHANVIMENNPNQNGGENI